jgi:hypothetical protein
MEIGRNYRPDGEAGQSFIVVCAPSIGAAQFLARVSAPSARCMASKIQLIIRLLSGAQAKYE